MMTDATDKAIPKLVDFGLAKILGPNEYTREAYGTVGYCAPEVLEKKPYNFSCDMWSFGIIVYGLLSSTLPYDHESEDEVQRMTIEDPVRYSMNAWKNVS